MTADASPLLVALAFTTFVVMLVINYCNRIYGVGNQPKSEDHELKVGPPELTKIVLITIHASFGATLLYATHD